MKRLMTLLFVLSCVVCTSVAQMYLSAPTELKQGYTGKVELVYYPGESAGDMDVAIDCYSHMGLLTSASKDENDIKYWAPGCDAGSLGSSSEPKWTKSYECWVLEFTDLYTYFGVTDPSEDITGISVIFHDGGSSRGWSRFLNHSNIVPFQKEVKCSYTVLMKDRLRDSWDGGYLTIWDNGYRTICYKESTSVAEEAAYVASYGGANKPSVTWTKGDYDEEVGFEIIASGGKIIYEEEAGGEVASSIAFSSDPCSTEAGAYTISNFKATETAPNAYEFTWDSNPAFKAYYVYYYDPEGLCFYIDYVEEPFSSLNFGMKTKKGDYRVRVVGLDDGGAAFGGGAETTLAITMEGVGQVDVRLLIPSDTEYDLSNGVQFRWYGEDSKRHPVEMTQEGSSRWWTATADITASRYWFEFGSDLSSGDKMIAEGTGGFHTEKSLCCEMGIYREMIGKTHKFKMNENISCDAQDHDYTILSSEAKVEDGVLTISWTPKADKPDYYTLIVYKGSGFELYNTFQTFDQEDITKYELVYMDSDPVTLSGWSIIGINKSGFGPYEVGRWYFEEKEVKLENPYFPKHISNKMAGYENRYVISWDAYDNAQNWKLGGYDDVGEPLFDKEKVYVVGEDIVRNGDRYEVTTLPVTVIGNCEVFLYPFDEEKRQRATGNHSFYASSLNNVGEVNLKVLIPEDACITTSGGVWVNWISANDGKNWVEMTKETGSNWWSAKFTVNDWSYSITIGNEDKSNWAFATRTETLNAAVKKLTLQIDERFSGKLELKPAQDDTKDFSYRATDVKVTANTAKGTVDVELTVSAKAPKYEVFFYKPTFMTPSFYCEIIPGEDETTTLHGVLEANATEDVIIDRVVVYAVNENDYESCAEFEKSVSLTIPCNPGYPTGLVATENDDLTVTLSWNAGEGVASYEVTAYYGSKEIASWWGDPIANKPVDGKYSVVLEDLYANSIDYSFDVSAYAADGSYLGTASQTFSVDKMKDLGNINLRVLIPTDNDIDISGGVWFCWCKPDQDVKTLGQFVEATKNGRWFEANVTTTAQAIRFVVINANSWSGSPAYSKLSPIIATNDFCGELGVTYLSPGEFPLRKAACDADDHNYTVTGLDIDNSKPGQATFTIKVNDMADKYWVFGAEKGSTDWFDCARVNAKEEGLTFTKLFPNKKDVEYEFKVWAIEGDRYMSAAGGFKSTIKANPNIPSALKAHVADDQQTVTFSWFPNGTEAVSYRIVAIDPNDDVQLDVKNITGNTYTHKFLVNASYSWYIQALNASGESIAAVWGLPFDIDGPVIKLSNLHVNVKGKKATLGWYAPTSVPMCHYFIYEYDTDVIVAEGDVTGNGLFTATFTLNEDATKTYYWSVYPETSDKQPLAVKESGPDFILVGSKEDPTPAATQYTLTISAAAGGFVNAAVNGKYDKDENVLIEAYPYSTDWDFVKWSDGDTHRKRVLKMDKDYTLQAIFACDATFTLYIEAGEHGKVNSEVNKTYEGGEVVTIVATPDAGYQFEQWSDGDTRATREVVMIDDYSFKATFVEISTFTLKVSIEPDDAYGKVKFDGVEESGNKKTVKSGTEITLKAEPAAGYKFLRFEDGVNTITTAEYKVKVTADKTIQAYFEKLPEAIETVESEKTNIESQKIFRDGHLYIMREEKVYTPTGVRVK